MNDREAAKIRKRRQRSRERQQKKEEEDKEKERREKVRLKSKARREQDKAAAAAMKARLEAAEKQLEIMEDENQDAVAPLNGAARLSASRTFQSPSGKGTINAAALGTTTPINQIIGTVENMTQ
jgi:hypothetical protein